MESGAPSEEPPRQARSSADEADPVSVAREIALRRLSVRARSRTELATDLARRGVEVDVADQVLNRFSEVGLVNDAAFAAEWVESRGHRSGAGRLRQELRLKGVSDDDIAAAVGSRDSEADLRAARDLAERKVRSLVGVEPVVQQRRLMGFLARRGFSNSVVRRVVSEVLGRDRPPPDADL